MFLNKTVTTTGQRKFIKLCVDADLELGWEKSSVGSEHSTISQPGSTGIIFCSATTMAVPIEALLKLQTHKKNVPEYHLLILM